MSDLNVKDVFVRFWTSLHEGVFRATEGRVLDRVLGMQVVRLTTKGRKSGQARVAMLTAPIYDDGQIVLVASNGGDYRHPAWYLNLVADPHVEVMLGGRTIRTLARVATPAQRKSLWPRVVAVNPGYAQYQAKTDREIPLVIIDATPN
ncbi:MAG TPA: nitroreductase family deazaflavin-dependent oxidoreductase [Acidimicrobiales bacterium]|nr:nitroreductase family deazaflavin-dependent oxidoreductase [Acidimicrobiales bacterium]